MSTPPAATQLFRVQGELRVITEKDAVNDRGIVSFYNDQGQMSAQMRVVESAPKAMLMDTYRLSSFAVRANDYEGITSLGGKDGEYSFYVSPSQCKMKKLVISAPQKGYPDDTGTTFVRGDPIFQATRYGTSAATTVMTFHSLFTQSTFRSTGEEVLIGIGEAGTGGIGYLGLYATTGFSNDTTRRLFLGLRSGATFNKAISMDPSGNVSIPATLTAGTVSATTYLNLPPVPASQLQPLTLNATSGFVGINKTTPTAALDVVGNVKVTGDIVSSTAEVTGSMVVGSDLSVNGGVITSRLDVLGDIYASGATIGNTLTADRVTANHYDNLPVQDVLPITLDKTNDRVGINVTVPEEALDVDGNIQTTGDLVVDGAVYLQGLVSESKSNILYYDFITKRISYASAPVPSLVPITLDPVNNRVGINQAVPTEALDVSGTIQTTRLIVNGTLANKGLIFTDITNNRVGIGSITPTTTLDVTGSTTTQTLNLTNIPATTTSNILYYNTTTKAVSHGAVYPTIIKDVKSTSYTLNASGTRFNICSVTLGPGTWQISATLVSLSDVVLSPSSISGIYISSTQGIQGLDPFSSKATPVDSYIFDGSQVRKTNVMSSPVITVTTSSQNMYFGFTVASSITLTPAAVNFIYSNLYAIKIGA